MTAADLSQLARHEAAHRAKRRVRHPLAIELDRLLTSRMYATDWRSAADLDRWIAECRADMRSTGVTPDTMIPQ